MPPPKFKTLIGNPHSSIIGKTIVAEEQWFNDDCGDLNLHYFLITSEGKIFYLMIIDCYDQYERFVEVTSKEKEEITVNFELKKK